MTQHNITKYVGELKVCFMQSARLSKHIQKVIAAITYQIDNAAHNDMT